MAHVPTLAIADNRNTIRIEYRWIMYSFADGRKWTSFDVLIMQFVIAGLVMTRPAIFYVYLVAYAENGVASQQRDSIND